MQPRQSQQQRLVLAPQVTLSLQVLQMTNLELQPFLQLQVESNPLLEITDDAEPAVPQQEEWTLAWQRQSAKEPSDEDPDRTDQAALERWVANAGSLLDSLKRQLGCQSLSAQQRHLGNLLIERIDEQGYLEGSLSDLAGEWSVPQVLLLDALKMVQRLDPPGVGARDLRECLLLQLEAAHEQDTLAWRILDRHFALFVQNRPVALAKACRAAIIEAEQACARLKRLNPKPGSCVSGALAQMVVPDMVVVRRDEHYDVELNDQFIPQMAINRSYYRMLRDPSTAADVREFLHDKFRQAGWVIRSIDERNATLLAIGRCLISLQRDFLDKGLAGLKPLTQAQVGDSIGRHPSTVSRAVAGKSIDTPSGIFRLDQLFASAVAQGQAGPAVSDASIKSEIMNLVRKEDSTHPLSDDQIVQRLRQRQLSVARRTVAKYRSALKILPARLRRKRLD
jgi:RNA polymerase sigma-54 factor